MTEKRTPVGEYRAAVSRQLGQASRETRELDWEAIGRVLAEPLVAGADLPRFDSSAMDGFAVWPASPGQRSFPVVCDVPAGTAPSRPLAMGQAARVMTGAPLPSGTVLVSPVERTDADSTGPAPAAVLLMDTPEPGRHVRRAGEDVKAGTMLAEAGARLTPALLALARSTGVSKAVLWKRPRVAVVATGAELSRPCEDAGAAGVFESNGDMIAALVSCTGALVARVTTCPDDPAVLRSLLSELDADITVDVVVTTGGVSQGAYEVVRQVCEHLPGFRFDQVAMQPGSPQGMGIFGATPVFCLPGTPSGAFVAFHVLLAAALMELCGHVRPEPRRMTYVGSAQALRRAVVRYVPGRSDGEANAVRAVVGGHLRALAAADCLIAVDGERGGVVEGDDVLVHRCLGTGQ